MSPSLLSQMLYPASGTLGAGQQGQRMVSAEMLCSTMIVGYMEEKSISATFSWRPITG
ncbi:MAG: hypothetical protein NTY64_05270 [Deltaproteobacteria bacterium]|nr:hypothetical protein [Deltaproteobacteria bacterium]